jgi:3-hydroxyisobutyrate dehydrogenase-like beta-hydroxyacid dehydrogenase
MKLGFLGLGKMGTPMALRLLAAGYELSVWNRSEGRTKPLIHEGAIAAATPAEAELGADAVMTMLSDDAAYEEVLFGPNGLVDALSPGGLHISCSTISPALSDRLTREYASRGIEFVAAPVFGSPTLAGEGGLWVLAAGADRALERARPLLETFSRGISVVGIEPKQAHAVKLGGDFLLSAMVHSLGEAFVFAARQGVEPETFLNVVNNALFQSPIYAEYANFLLHPAEQVAASVEPHAKDPQLLRQAAASRHIRLRLADQIAEIFAEMRRTGPAGQDGTVHQYSMAQRRRLTGE